MRSHDLTGAVFQRLIADRKFLAAYYTTPAAAALLVGLAITPDRPPAGGSWANADDVKTLRIADFACGTGTLLSTAYQRVGQLHELAGGDAEALHPEMMAHGLIGCDVLPAAAHLTASMLSGAHPTVKYKQSSIMTVAYGQQPDGGLRWARWTYWTLRETWKSLLSLRGRSKAWVSPRRKLGCRFLTRPSTW